MLRRGSVEAQHSTTHIQRGGCCPSITHKYLTSTMRAVNDRKRADGE
jgi:hypothetical protein